MLERILPRFSRNESIDIAVTPRVPARAQAALRLRAAILAESAAYIAHGAIAEMTRPANRAEVGTRSQVIDRSLARIATAERERIAAARALDAIQDDPDGCGGLFAVEDRSDEPWAMASNPYSRALASRPDGLV